MSSDSSAGQPASDDGTRRLIAALDVPRLAGIGFGAGVVLSLATFIVFIVLPAGDGSPWLYLGLGFVLALSLGLLFTMLLVAASAYRLVRRTDLDEPVAADEFDDD